MLAFPIPPVSDMYSIYSTLQVVGLFVVQSEMRKTPFQWVMLLRATRPSCCHSNSRQWVIQIIKFLIMLFESSLLIGSVQIINENRSYLFLSNFNVSLSTSEITIWPVIFFNISAFRKYYSKKMCYFVRIVSTRVWTG